jgi:hypothetical protein
MRHPGEKELALFAGGDLGFLAQWRVSKHVERCAGCRAAVESFEALRAESAALAELPADLNWRRLASEMQANIRLGLAAGECVAGYAVGPKRPRFSTVQTAVAYAGLIALVVAGVWMQRPSPTRPATASAPAEEGATLEATGEGIELSDSGGSFGLRYHPARNNDVYFSADAGGAMRARYVDKGTGYVTVVKVNVE